MTTHVRYEHRHLDVACDLNAAELGARAAKWRQLRDSAGLGAARIDGGARLWLRREAAAAAGELARREAACCGFLDFELAPDGDRLRLDITSPAPHGGDVAASLAGLHAEPEPGMLLIGEVAGQTGLAPSTIRYYEELGLIEPCRRESGRRLFAEGTTRRLRAVAAAREAGFSLAEIGRLLGSQADGTGEWRSLVEAKIDSVEARVERLQAVARTLRDSLDCGCRAWDQCPAVVS